MTQGIVNGKQKPTVTTSKNFEIPVEGSIHMKAEIVFTGKSDLVNKGFYWGYTPEEMENVILSTDNSPQYSALLSDVPGGETYYWRAFAENSFGADFGEIVRYEAPRIWEIKDIFNAIIRARGAIFTLNNRIFTTCGERESGSGNLLNDTWQYNIQDNKWWQTNDFAGMKRRYPVAFTIGNSAYVGTGQGNEQGVVLLNDFYRYDNTLNAWLPLTVNENIEARHQAMAFSLKNKGYIVGGLRIQNQRMNDVWQYTETGGNTGSWTRMNNFPVLISGGISIAGNNMAFIGFGDNPEAHKILWKYNDSTDSWEEFTELPDNIVKKIYSGVIIKDKIYIVDGDNIIWEIGISDKKWKKKTVLPDVFLNIDGDGGNQNLFSTENSSSIYVGLGFSQYFYEYRPLWDN
jgi:N-acetylneuraminic acid mutarotase